MKWEYKYDRHIIKFDMDDVNASTFDNWGPQFESWLNSYGDEGWELVRFDPTWAPGSITAGAIWKRPR